MKSELADYILCLSDCLARTNQAEDRPLYRMYLADAAVLLALAECGADTDVLRDKVDAHERLLGNTWLRGDEHEAVSGKWKRVKQVL